MRKLTENELKQLIENHGHWLREDCTGWENMRANLSEANLSGGQRNPVYPYHLPRHGRVYRVEESQRLYRQAPDSRRCEALLRYFPKMPL